VPLIQRLCILYRTLRCYINTVLLLLLLLLYNVMSVSGAETARGSVKDGRASIVVRRRSHSEVERTSVITQETFQRKSQTVYVSRSVSTTAVRHVLMTPSDARCGPPPTVTTTTSLHFRAIGIDRNSNDDDQGAGCSAEITNKPRRMALRHRSTQSDVPGPNTH